MPTPTGHVMLSPSTSHRWLVCTPSAKLESYEPGISSKYAEEGTEAHALAELKLSYMLGKISPEEYDTKFEYFRMTSKFYDEVFNDYVNSYCQEVMTIVKEDYKDFSEVEKAIAAVVKGLDITKQEEVDGYAKAIEEAISKLEVKEAEATEEDKKHNTGKEETKGNEVTKTGYDTNVMIYVVAFVLAISLGIILFVRRKKE